MFEVQSSNNIVNEDSSKMIRTFLLLGADPASQTPRSRTCRRNSTNPLSKPYPTVRPEPTYPGYTVGNEENLTQAYVEYQLLAEIIPSVLKFLCVYPNPFSERCLNVDRPKRPPPLKAVWAMILNAAVHHRGSEYTEIYSVKSDNYEIAVSPHHCMRVI
jgi:hypothetical protein